MYITRRTRECYSKTNKQIQQIIIREQKQSRRMLVGNKSRFSKSSFTSKNKQDNAIQKLNDRFSKPSFTSKRRNAIQKQKNRFSKPSFTSKKKEC